MRDDPNLWQVPQWHPDWDGDFEFAGLRSVAKAVLDATDLDVKLSIVEEGYMHVDVFGGSTRIGMVYVNRADDPSVPQFSIYAGAEDDELTTTDVVAAVLGARRNVWPSAMSREMGGGFKAYVLTIGQPATELVDIFDVDESPVGSTVSEQESFAESWFDSLGN